MIEFKFLGYIDFLCVKFKRNMSDSIMYKVFNYYYDKYLQSIFNNCRIGCFFLQ